MTSRLAPVIVVLVSVGLSVGAVHLLRDDRVLPEVPPFDVGRLDRLEARLAALEQRPVELRAEGLPIEPARPVREELPADRLAELERRIAEVETMRGPAEPAQQTEAERERIRAEAEGARRKAVAVAKSRILDAMASNAEKVKAQGALRREANAYTDEMLQVLARIAQTDADPELRASVWRQFDGSTRVPSLIPSLLHALANDQSPKVREEAAETLGDYLDDPGVRAALRHAAEHDPHGEVRREAIQALKGVELLEILRPR